MARKGRNLASFDEVASINKTVNDDENININVNDKVSNEGKANMNNTANINSHKDINADDDINKDINVDDNNNVNINDNVEESKKDYLDKLIEGKTKKSESDTVLTGIYLHKDLAQLLDRLGKKGGRGAKSKIVNEALRSVFKEKGLL